MSGRRPALRWASILSLVVGVSGASGCIEARPDPIGGAALYQRHCAVCHGASGLGDGPVAASLETSPPDLTTLARRSDGVFEEARLIMTIDGRQPVAEHGPREMPVWGAVFAEDHVGEPFAIYGPALDARALVDYLRTIQVD